MASLKETAPVFVVVDGTKFTVLGQTYITFISQDPTYTYPVFIIQNLLFEVIFGLDFLTHSETRLIYGKRKLILVSIRNWNFPTLRLKNFLHIRK